MLTSMIPIVCDPSVSRDCDGSRFFTDNNWRRRRAGLGTIGNEECLEM